MSLFLFGVAFIIFSFSIPSATPILKLRQGRRSDSDFHATGEIGCAEDRAVPSWAVLFTARGFMEDYPSSIATGAELAPCTITL